MEDLKLSVVIVNYKSEKYLKGCIDSFSKYLPNGSEIIVVNNSPYEKLGSIGMVITPKENLGFAKANNLGAKYANNEILLFLNPDTKVLSNLSLVLSLFSKDPKVGVIGADLVDEHGNVNLYSFGKKQTLLRLLVGQFGSFYLVSKSVDWVSGAAMFVRKCAFDRVGGFDEKFFMYFEDQDLCLRIKELGYKVVPCEDFKVLHYGGGSFRTEKYKQKEYYYNSQDYFFRKHNGFFSFMLMKSLRFIWLKVKR